MTFEEMCLDTRIMRAIAEMGFEQPSPIQAQSIPIAVEGKDMIGQARTGTGKTASFGIPMLQRINPKDKNLQAIVLCPTRELAIQSANEIRKLAKFLHGIKVLPIYGGQEISKQIRSLKGGVQIVIGTPGRVMDHLRRHTLKPQTVDIVVLDEADEMLNMGFREDIETILGQLPEERQTMLFSATMPKPILEIAKRYLHEPEIVKVIQKELTVPKIEQYYYEVNPRKKNEVLSRLLDMYDPSLSLVFCNTKRKVDELVADLKGRGYFAEGLHGDMKQSQRDRVMNGFRNGRTDILVATDVAARGIDVDDVCLLYTSDAADEASGIFVDDVEAVFKYDVPQDDEYYVHRIGRTGRAGREGRAFTLVVGKEIYKLKDIQRYCKTKIRRQPIPSVNDVAAIKVEKLLEQAGELIATDGLGRMMDLLEEYLDGSDYSATEMAAALLAMQLGETSTQTLPKEEFGDTGAEPGMVRMFMNIGKKDRVRIGDILGAVAGESGMEGALVGTIDMYDNFSFVEVPQEYAAAVLEAMNHSKIKGRRVNMEPAKNVRN